MTDQHMNTAVTVATCGVSVMAAALKHARDLCRMSTQSGIALNDAHEGILDIIDRLKGLEKHCDVLQRKCTESHASMENCIEVWKKATSQFHSKSGSEAKPSQEQQVNIILEDLLCTNDKQLKEVTLKFQELEESLQKLDTNLQALHKTTL